MNSIPPIAWALCSNVAFATASLVFTTYARKTTPAWMNFYKGLVAFFCFLLVCLCANVWIPLPFKTFLFLVISGSCGLWIGDIFLLKAFTHLGSGRVLMLFGFQPLILGIGSFYFFGQTFSWIRLIAILLLIGCLFSFSLESFRHKGHWDLPGLGYALLGVALDACGILLTRGAFENSPELSPFLANLIRAGATTVGFIGMSFIPYFQLSLAGPWQKLNIKEKFTATWASALGTFLSLSFYLIAIQKGHLATISAVAGTSPLFATLFETLLGKKKATPYLFWGIAFFVSGVWVLLFL